MEVIGDKRKVQILMFLLEKVTIKKYDFLEIMKNMYIIDISRSWKKMGI